MRYFVTFPSEEKPASRTYAVDITELPNGGLEVRLDGRAVEVDVVPAGHQVSVRVDGWVVDLTTHGTPPELTVAAAALRAAVRVESERSRSADEGRSGPASRGDKVIPSPMPGRVVKLLVGEGEAVRAGQGLVVLEAMKMENEVRAPRAGTVARVHVAAGDTVEGRAKLVTLA